MFCIYSHKNSFKNIRTDVKIFPSTIAYWSGLVIFKEKQDNPDETIRMVGQSALIIGHHSGHESFHYDCTMIFFKDVFDKVKKKG